MFKDMGGSPTGKIPNQPALFGNPMGQGEDSILGNIVYPIQKTEGCQALNASSDLIVNNTGSLILLLDRGDCYFYQKVQHAQDVGAHAAVIVDNIDESYIPYMADYQNFGAKIKIPSVLIHKNDGQKIKDQMTTSPNTAVFIKFAWNVPHPDNTVDVNFFISSESSDSSVKTFYSSFQDAAKVFGTSATVTPHYMITPSLCYSGDADFEACKAKSCIQDGKYCAISANFDGADVVRENLRQMCIFKTLNSTGYTNTDKWWTYVNLFQKNCIANSAFTEDCSKTQQASAGIDANAVTSCIDACTVGNKNTCLDDELALQQDRNIWTYPMITINNQPYRGSIYCPEPVDKSSCGVLAMVCKGFKDVKDVAACNGNGKCKLGQKPDACGICDGPGADACGKCYNTADDPQRVSDASKCSTGDTSIKFPTWGVVLIVLGCVSIVGFGVAYFMRRREEAMREDIDKLLQQYINLGDQGQTA